eukprot:CAMPEP_0168331066 /NCGR_PEP_ID=MMETSP0213-20121227/8111_1 /TAXON_ID=151035 /ORGANISM="Euplotes harpa, Strain FSP1.4" /LENGTH=72 /DNA_ID=CAMNT_0008334769 /DNA_START=251 /DNA_END=469 /DNA_ORIENTATION=+
MKDLLDFYQKLCNQERNKLNKMKELILEREEMLTKINSMLDISADIENARPKTAQVGGSQTLEVLAKPVTLK